MYNIQSDQLNMDMFFRYLVKRDLSNVQCTRVLYSSLNRSSHFFKVQEKHGHV